MLRPRKKACIEDAMPEKQSVMLAVSSDSRSHIQPAADYFQKRARQCQRLAEKATDDEAAIMLRRLASAFQAKARALEC
jgi:hypothetical protein